MAGIGSSQGHRCCRSMWGWRGWRGRVGKGVGVPLPPPFPIKMGSLRQVQLYKVDHFSFCFLCFCVFDLELFFVSRTQESNLEKETNREVRHKKHGNKTTTKLTFSQSILRCIHFCFSNTGKKNKCFQLSPPKIHLGTLTYAQKLR